MSREISVGMIKEIVSNINNFQYLNEDTSLSELPMVLTITKLSLDKINSLTVGQLILHYQLAKINVIRHAPKQSSKNIKTCFIDALEQGLSDEDVINYIKERTQHTYQLRRYQNEKSNILKELSKELFINLQTRELPSLEKNNTSSLCISFSTFEFILNNFRIFKSYFSYRKQPDENIYYYNTNNILKNLFFCLERAISIVKTQLEPCEIQLLDCSLKEHNPLHTQEQLGFSQPTVCRKLKVIRTEIFFKWIAEMVEIGIQKPYVTKQKINKDVLYELTKGNIDDIKPHLDLIHQIDKSSYYILTSRGNMSSDASFYFSAHYHLTRHKAISFSYELLYLVKWVSDNSNKITTKIN